MPLTYLDHNIIGIAAGADGKDMNIAPLLENAKSQSHQFVYSPAHCEEIAVILRSDIDRETADTYVWQLLNKLSELTDNLEFLPPWDRIGASIQKREEPIECFKRVVEYYDLTLSSESLQKFIMSFKSPEAFTEFQQEYETDIDPASAKLYAERRQRHNINPIVISNLSPEKVLEQPSILAMFNEELWGQGLRVDTIPKFGQFKDSFVDQENSINLTMLLMEKIGYRADPWKKYRSTLHDITHTIYASNADYFITNDSKTLARVKATYAFLDVPTEVCSLQEFEAIVNAAGKDL